MTTSPTGSAPAGRVGEGLREGRGVDLFDPLTFRRGSVMRNRLALSPMTTQQSHLDGQVSEDDIDWLASRARGGFGMTVTCSAPVQVGGAGVERLLSVYSDIHIDGLTRLATQLRDAGSLGVVQLYHAGPRVDAHVVPEPVAASDVHGARALTLDEVHQVVQDFVAAAVRVEKAGFDGVEIHGAHGYLITQFLAPGTNHRVDEYGGSLENRARLLMEVLRGVRSTCGPDFQLGLRLSTERYGLRTLEVRDLVQELYATADLDFVDLSLWDVDKYSEDDGAQHLPLLEMFAELPRGGVRLGVAGKVRTPAQAGAVLERGADFAMIGRGGVLHRDYAELARDPGWEPVSLPAAVDHFTGEGISPRFRTLLQTRWDDIVAQ